MSYFVAVPPAGRLLRLALAAAFLSIPSAGLGQDGSGAGSYYDSVTGYRCIDRFCTVVQLPGTECMCQKLNPSERTLSQLQLRCLIRGQACPAAPRLEER